MNVNKSMPICQVGPLKFKNGINHRTWSMFQKLDTYHEWLQNLMFHHCQKIGDLNDAYRLAKLRIELENIGKEIDDIIKRQSTVILNQSIQELQKGAVNG